MKKSWRKNSNNLYKNYSRKINYLYFDALQTREHDEYLLVHTPQIVNGFACIFHLKI